MTMLASGQRIGPFELQRRLGRGGSGEVWEALLHGPGGFRKPVALKMVRERALVDPEQQELLLREARLGARLQHPNLVSTLLVGAYEGRLCVALELVRGRSLQQLVKATGPLPATALLDVGEQTAMALHHIHTFRYNGRSEGMVHRDVKPANLLVDGLGTVKLADLGISMGLTEAGGIAGTPSYMAPEQWAGRAEPRSDLFALGVTLYGLASGHLPFERPTDARAAARQAEARIAEPDFLEPLEARCPGLGRVVRACLRADPADRPPSAWSVAQVLSTLRASAPAGPSLRALVTDAAPELAPESGMPSLLPTPTVPQPRGNLRVGRDAFVGRQEELAALRAKVAEGAWVVVLGPGGMGKTRLCTELARQMQLEMPGGVWAVDLSEARSVDEVCAAVATAFDVPLGRGDAVEQLGHVMAAKGSCLVLLDNLEQCVYALAATVDRWRGMAPSACLLGTSRIRPGLPDEQVVRLGVLEEADAVELFETRASRSLTEAERADVVALCAALEHMPLPVELAAARVAMMPGG